MQDNSEKVINDHDIRIGLSDTTNLIEQSAYHYSLQERETPNLYRHLFDYESVPKVSFNHRFVPMNMPKEIWITDTTFRDGQQSTAPFTVKQIVDLYKLMSRLGGKNGIIRQTEFFVYTEKDRRALEECMSLGLEFPEITCWIRANEKDFDLVKSLGIKETGILVSCSDYHIYNKMGLTRKSALEKYLRIVKSAMEHGIRPRCHFEDITRADYYGFVVPFVEALERAGEEYGIPVKIRACDTMGYGVSYAGAALPRSVPGIIYGFGHYAGVKSENIEWHGHNDFYKVVTNSSTAWLYGASSVNCSLLGIGERVAVAAGGGCGAAVCRHIGLLDFRVASRQHERCGYDAGRGSESHLFVHNVPLRQERAGGRTRTPCRSTHAFAGRRASRFRLSRIIPVRKSFVRLSSKVHGARLRRRLGRLTGRFGLRACKVPV